MPELENSAILPPPKPPRGVLRKIAPMKPLRQPLRVEPLMTIDDNTAKQFSATALYENMKSNFKDNVTMKRSGGEFTGVEAADVLEGFITKNRHLFKAENITRINAIKLLNTWLHENVFRQLNQHGSKEFQDSERVFYALCHEKDYKLFIAPAFSSPTPTLGSEDTASNTSSALRPSRSSSFKRLFSPMGLVRRNRSASRGRDSNTTLFKSTMSLFGGDRSEKKAARELENRIKEEEAEIYESALSCLLSLVEIQFLEEIAIPLDFDAKKNASFLSSILEKMGLGGEERPDSRLEDEMDLLIETHPLIRPASQWFQMARSCAPMLHLEKTSGKSSGMQMYIWCKSALEAVSARLEKMTQRGENPLVPREFDRLLTAMAESLFDRGSSEQKLEMSLQYLWLMIPTPLRSMLDLILQWLEWTQKTAAVVDLRSPYYLGPDCGSSKNNCAVIIDELRPYLFPRGCLTNNQQDAFINTLLEIRSKGLLGTHPAPLANALKRKAVMDQENVFPARNSPPKAPPTNMEQELVNVMKLIIDNTQMSLSEKKKRLRDFAKFYPEIYEKHFKDLRW
ncbi:unnamed protein product [Caenorhabditis auriculariae]|uniref:DEP domain-containing protein n=1 Tax=Caenorhabditis auriculariae TaxID=2777116 RepID=A0A8S1H8P7_9PELO|nr:unnamed protein product [Caenorhabditis auriculariae]